MSDYCFGAHYFATRDRLSQLMHGIARLARQTATQLDQPLPFTGGPSTQDTPFLFAVCGEVNAGKSSFINGLYGHPLCEVSDLPQPQAIRHYRYGDTTKDLDSGNYAEKSYRPLKHLRDFQVVDTPGIESGENPKLENLADFLTRSDLIFYVFPISNPWAAPTWNSLSTLDPHTLSKTILVVQQADQREPRELQVMREHVADLASKRLSHVPPIFTVSGQLAMQAKQTNPTDLNRLHASGYMPLEAFISKHIHELESRRESLKSWQRQAATALSTVEDRIEDKARSIRDQSRFMDTIEQEIDEMRETFIKRLPIHLVDVAETFEKEAGGVSKRLRGRLGAIRSIARLFLGDRTGARTETAFIERIRSAVEIVAHKDSLEVVEACKDHWNELESRVMETMGVQLTTTRPVEETLKSSQERFVKRLSRAAEQGINNLKVRNQLDKELRRRNLALKSFTSMTLILVSAGAVCGALGVPWAPVILLGMAALFLCGGILTAWITRKSIIRDFKEHLLDTCGAFASTLHNDYEEALRIVFKDYAGALSEVRDYLGREKLAIDPRLRSWQELFLTLKTIEQDS